MEEKKKPNPFFLSGLPRGPGEEKHNEILRVKQFKGHTRDAARSRFLFRLPSRDNWPWARGGESRCLC